MYFLRNKFKLNNLRSLLVGYSRLFKQTGCNHKLHYLHYKFIEHRSVKRLSKNIEENIKLHEKVFIYDDVPELKAWRAKIKESIDKRNKHVNI